MSNTNNTGPVEIQSKEEDVKNFALAELAQARTAARGATPEADDGEVCDICGYGMPIAHGQIEPRDAELGRRRIEACPIHGNTGDSQSESEYTFG